MELPMWLAFHAFHSFHGTNEVAPCFRGTKALFFGAIMRPAADSRDSLYAAEPRFFRILRDLAAWVIFPRKNGLSATEGGWRTGWCAKNGRQ